MEQRLTIYRKHTPVCVHGYKKPIYEGPLKVPDCFCPLSVEGYLRHVLDDDGKPKRIRHRSLGRPNQPIKDWHQARLIRDQWVAWGNFEETSVTQLPKSASVEQAVQFFTDFRTKMDGSADSTKAKYDTLFRLRLLPWAKANRKQSIKDFDDPLTVKSFYMSWRNLQPERGKGVVLDSDVDLGKGTKSKELERLRTFLEFCLSNKWIGTNYAKRPHIKSKTPKPVGKQGFTDVEWLNIDDSLLSMEDRYQDRKKFIGRDVKRAFVHALRWTGQRLSDVTMLGPHSIVEDEGNFFIELTQIKCGSQVRVPVDVELVEMLRALPVLGESPAPISLKRSNWTCHYGTKFWFWSADVSDGSDLNAVIENAAKKWSDRITAVLDFAQQKHRKFENHSTPHTFRHTFAIGMLSEGVPIETVAKWLGDTVKTVQTHYFNANKTFHDESHRKAMAALKSIKGKLQGKKKAVKVLPMRKAG